MKTFSQLWEEVQLETNRTIECTIPVYVTAIRLVPKAHLIVTDFTDYGSGHESHDFYLTTHGTDAKVPHSQIVNLEWAKLPMKRFLTSINRSKGCKLLMSPTMVEVLRLGVFAELSLLVTVYGGKIGPLEVILCVLLESSHNKHIFNDLMTRFERAASAALYTNVVSRIEQGAYMRKSVSALAQLSLEPGNTQRQAKTPPKRISGATLVFQPVTDDTQGPLFPPSESDDDSLTKVEVSNKSQKPQHIDKTNGVSSGLSSSSANGLSNSSGNHVSDSIQFASQSQSASQKAPNRVLPISQNEGQQKDLHSSDNSGPIFQNSPISQNSPTSRSPKTQNGFQSREIQSQFIPLQNESHAHSTQSQSLLRSKRLRDREPSQSHKKVFHGHTSDPSDISVELQVDRTTQVGEDVNTGLSESVPGFSQVIMSSQAEITSGQRVADPDKDSIALELFSGLDEPLSDDDVLASLLHNKTAKSKKTTHECVASETETTNTPPDSQLVNETTVRALLKVPESLQEIQRNLYYKVTAKIQAIIPDTIIIKPFGRTLKIGDFKFVLIDGGAQINVEFHTEAEMCTFFGLEEVEQTLARLQEILQLQNLLHTQRSFVLHRKTLPIKSGYIYSYWTTTTTFSELINSISTG